MTEDEKELTGAVISAKVQEIIDEAEETETPMQHVAEAIKELVQYLADFE